MHFEYLHLSVAQKLTDLRIFGFQGQFWVVLSDDLERLGTLFSYDNCIIEVSASRLLTNLIFLPTHLLRQLFIDLMTYILHQLIFWQLIFWQLFF